MNILFYASREFNLPRKLFEAIREAGLGEVEFEHLRHSRELRERFRQSGREPSLVILCPADHLELRELAAMGDYLIDCNLILIVPDETAETIALAHRLRPRFLCYIDENADRVGEVAWNILNREAMSRTSS